MGRAMGQIQPHELALDLSKNKENFSSVDDRGKAHLRNVKTRNIECNTRKLDVNYDTLQTKSVEKLCKTPQNNSSSYKDRSHTFNTRPSVSSETKKPSNSLS